MNHSSKKTYFPRTRLADLAARPGGVFGDKAVADATDNIQEMRAESVGLIDRMILDIERVAVGAQADRLSEAEMNLILVQADQVVTLAGTFGYRALDAAARSLCDVTDGLLGAGMRDAAPIAVHARALRLLAPGAQALPEAAVDSILTELSKIMTHFNFTSLGTTQIEDGLEAATG